MIHYSLKVAQDLSNKKLEINEKSSARKERNCRSSKRNQIKDSRTFAKVRRTAKKLENQRYEYVLLGFSYTSVRLSHKFLFRGGGVRMKKKNHASRIYFL